VYLLGLWSLYHYYDHDYNLLPRAKDGGLSYGLIKCMMAIDQYYREGEEYQKSVGGRDIEEKTSDTDVSDF